MKNKVFVILISVLAIFTFISISSATSWPSYLNTNLTIYLKMDSGNSTHLINYANYSLNGTLTNSPNYVTNGKINNASNWSASLSQKGTIVYNLPTGNKAKTISAWINATTSSSAGQFLVSGGNTSAFGGFGIGFTYNSNDDKFWCWGQGAGDFIAPTASTKNVWHHVVCVDDGANKRYLYVDGVEVSSSTTGWNTGTGNIILASSGTSNYFTGLIDEVGIWERALNATEVALLNTSIQYSDDFTSPSIAIYEPNTTYTNITYIPINFTATDNQNLNICYYNVTRGASLEVSNTIISCTATVLNFTVTGSASYVFNLFAIDTSGNSAYNSTSFVTASYVPPPTIIIGGGGGGVSFTNTTWMVRTDSNAFAYNLKMSANDIRNKPLYFTNLGTDDIVVALTCDGNACPFISADNNSITVPASKINNVVLNLKIRTQNASLGLYTANIVAIDVQGGKNSITINLDVSSTGYIFSLFSKLGDSADIFSIKIPYIIIVGLVGLLFFFGTVKLLNKSDLGPAIGIIVAVIAGFASLILI